MTRENPVPFTLQHPPVKGPGYGPAHLFTDCLWRFWHRQAESSGRKGDCTALQSLQAVLPGPLQGRFATSASTSVNHSSPLLPEGSLGMYLRPAAKPPRSPWPSALAPELGTGRSSGPVSRQLLHSLSCPSPPTTLCFSLSELLVIA